jgi:DNA-binding SARP family transcriptional activator
MEIQVLGPLEVRAAGQPLALGGVQQRAVFAMLALHLNEVVSTDFLVDGLWGGRAPPASATNTVQVYVSRLRRALQAADAFDPVGGAVLQRRGPGYLLELDPERLDLHRFERLVREGAQALRPAPARAASTLREALGLWRGQPLAEFADEPFARAEMPRLEQQRLAALEAYLEAELALGRHAQLVGELETLVACHPLHEGLRRLLMLSLYRSGRQAEALEAYRRARHTLSEELGIHPGRMLRELQSAILTQDRNLEWAPPTTEPPEHVVADVPFAGAAVPRPRVWNMPARNPHFTGRDDMLTELRRRLHGDENTLVVHALYGLGGVGKTQLALEYAHRFAADYELVWWIDAEQSVLIPDQLTRLAERLGLPPGPTVFETVNRLLAELRSRAGWLLILDNAERPADIAAYRPGGAGHVLITSRFPGWGALGGRLEVDVLARTETVALLRSRIPTLDEELADKLAAELGDLPLAAAQAAGYLEQTALPAADYLSRFRVRQASLLARGDVVGYHGRIDTTWALSLERLRVHDPAGVQLLELAAFLAPEPIPLFLVGEHPELLGEPLRATAADPDALSDTVGALVGYSLARRHPDGFQVHRLVQAVIRHQLPRDRQQVTVQRVVGLLSAASPGDPEDPASWTAYALLAPHVLAIASLSDRCPTGRHLVLNTAHYLHAHGDSHAGRAVCQQMIDRWRSIIGPDHPDTLTAASRLTLALFSVGEAEQARTLGQDTLQRSRQVLGPDSPTTLEVATALTVARVSLGEVEAARSLAEDTLQRCRRVLGPDHPMTLWVAGDLTAALLQVGEMEAARTLAENTLQRCLQVLGRDHAITLWVANCLTVARVSVGEVEAARDLGEDTLQRCRRVLDPDHITTLGAATALTVARVSVGEVESARALGEDTLQRCRRVLGRDHTTTLWAATALTHALAQLGEHESARALGEDTLQRCRRVLGPEHPIAPYLARAADIN